MGQTREKWDSIVLNDMKVPLFRVFVFIFLFRNNGIREQLYQNDFRCCYGEFFFESVIPQVLDHSYVQSSFSTITRHLDKVI